MTDIELFENHRRGSDQAFADLVQHHLGWIYGVARRGLRDSHRAEDVAQTVFVLLHRKAPRFAADAAMIGWLHKATCYATKTLAREERRRKQRETEVALEQSRRPGTAAPDSDTGEPDWQQLAPVIDEMVGQLSRADREAILLRYYRNLTFVQLGAEIGTTEEAARKRVDRAIQKLRRMAVKRGLSYSATLPLYLASQIRIAPPAGLLATSTVAATAAPGSVLAASSEAIIKGAFVMQSIKSTLAIAAIVGALLLAIVMGAGIWWVARHGDIFSIAARNPDALIEPPAIRAIQPPAGFVPDIHINSNFDCGTPVNAVEDSPNHVTITLQQFQLDWWMFRLNGVAGKTVTIDIAPNPASRNTLGKWSALNPVYSYAADLSDPKTFISGPIDPDASKGRRIPNTDQQVWHYITDCQLADDLDFTMTQTFTADSVYIAGRVPYTPGYNAKFMDDIATNPLAKVIDLGETPEARPIRIVQIGATDQASQKSKPCILICGGEQAYQPDGMWACHGCLEFLLGDSDSAKALRSQYVFLVIPMLDPDGTAHARPNFVASFLPQRAFVTSIAYANWLQNRVLSGGRIDVVLELHSLQSGECEHLQHVDITPRQPERRALLRALQKRIVQQFTTDHLLFSPASQQGGMHSPARFAGWVGERFGGLDTIYELNAQAPARHLTLAQLKDTGRLFAQASADFLASPDGQLLLASVDKARSDRQAAWTGNPATQPSKNAIESEAAITTGQ